MLNKAESVDPDASFLLAIKRTGTTQNHSAVVLRDEDGKLKLLHLGWNYTLIYEDCKSSYFWVSNTLDPATSLYLAVICDRIGQRRPGIPYGLDAEGLVIDPETGNVTPGPLGKGFTCATFILGILKAVGIYLLLEEDWPEDANVAWQQHIVSTLECDPSAPPEQVAAVREDIGSKRFSPEEVVGSSIMDDWPVSFGDAQARGAEVNQDLDDFASAA